MVVLEQFYFFCPLVILAVNWKVSEPRQRRNVLIGLCLLMMLTAQLIQLYYFYIKQPVFTWPLKSTTPYWTITANLGSISFGALLAILEPNWSLWKNNRWLGLVLWVTGMAIFFYLFFVLDWSYYWGDWYLYTFGYLTVGLLIFAAYHGISLFARLGCFQWLGRHSYGIYIWHYLVLEFWKIWIGTFPPEIIIIGCFVTSIAAGVLSTNTIERYFLTLRSKLVPSI
jgi:peptidoglycan/LPS O-acetylase OafA/YrhL